LFLFNDLYLKKKVINAKRQFRFVRGRIRASMVAHAQMTNAIVK